MTYRRHINGAAVSSTEGRLSELMAGKLVIHWYRDGRILDRNCSPTDIFTEDVMTSQYLLKKLLSPINSE